MKSGKANLSRALSPVRTWPSRSRTGSWRRSRPSRRPSSRPFGRQTSKATRTSSKTCVNHLRNSFSSFPLPWKKFIVVKNIQTCPRKCTFKLCHWFTSCLKRTWQLHYLPFFLLHSSFLSSRCYWRSTKIRFKSFPKSMPDSRNRTKHCEPSYKVRSLHCTYETTCADDYWFLNRENKMQLVLCEYRLGNPSLYVANWLLHCNLNGYEYSKVYLYNCSIIYREKANTDWTNCKLFILKLKTQWAQISRPIHLFPSPWTDPILWATTRAEPYGD